MPVIESLAALKAVVGIAGVASALYTNYDKEGNFDFGEFPKAFFGETFGGIIADCFRQGLSRNYENLKAQYATINLDKDNLNHDLQKAARKAQLIATFFAAQYCLEQIKAENNSAISLVGKTFEKTKNFIAEDSREAYLKEVIEHLNREVQNIEKYRVVEILNFEDFTKVFDTYRQAVAPDLQAQIAATLKQDIYNELEYLSKFPDSKFDRDTFSFLTTTIDSGWEELPPGRALSEKFVTLDIARLKQNPLGKKYDWFFLVCSIFNEEYKNKPRVQAAAQKSVLLEISGKLGTFGMLNTKIPDLISQINRFAEDIKKIREVVERTEQGVERLERISARIEARLNAIAPEKVDSPNLIGLPSLRDKVYGRQKEIRLLLEFLEGEKKHGVFVAPTCFGKTYLVKKFLWTITEVGGVKTEYRRLIEKVIYLDCRENQTMTRILQSFANLLGQELKYQQSEERQFLKELSTNIQTQKILLVFDNFESWIDENGNYLVGQGSDGVRDESVRDFLGALFGSHHEIRGIFVSQKIPNQEKNFRQVENLKQISDELEEGLEPEAALELAQKEGASVELDKVSPEALKRFFARVHYVPQAIQSMIGYLETVGESFAKFETEFWADFDREEQGFRDGKKLGAEEREKLLNDKLRPTKFLIERQIEKQNETTRFLLSLLAFFGVSVPKDVLTLSLAKVKGVENAADRSRAVKVLIDNRLAKTEEDLVRERNRETGAEEKIIYFTLHPYFQEITLKQLPAFEAKSLDVLQPFAEELFDKGYESQVKDFLRKSIGYYECAESIYENLASKFKHANLRDDLAAVYMNKSVALRNLQRLDESITDCKKSIEMYEQLVLRENNLELRNSLASAYMNKGVTLKGLQRFDEAIAEYEKSIKIREKLVLHEKKSEFGSDLAKVYMNKGNALRNLERLHEAIAEQRKSIEVYEQMIVNFKWTDLITDLAINYMNIGNVFANLQRFDDAIAEYEKSIKILEHSVMRKNRLKWRGDLAKSYANKGNSLGILQRLDEAIADYDKAIDLWIKENALQNLPTLMITLRNKILLLIKLRNWQKTAENALLALNYILLLENPSLSEHFKQLIGEEIGYILQQIKRLANEEQEAIYAFAGEHGEYLRSWVEQV